MLPAIHLPRVRTCKQSWQLKAFRKALSKFSQIHPLQQQILCYRGISDAIFSPSLHGWSLLHMVFSRSSISVFRDPPPGHPEGVAMDGNAPSTSKQQLYAVVESVGLCLGQSMTFPHIQSFELLLFIGARVDGLGHPWRGKVPLPGRMAALGGLYICQHAFMIHAWTLSSNLLWGYKDVDHVSSRRFSGHLECPETGCKRQQQYIITATA